MKKVFNRVKTWLLALWVTIVSFFSKAMGQYLISDFREEDLVYQSAYASPDVPLPESSWSIIVKVAQRALVGVVFIIWIINLIKIKKTDDKVQRKKRIRKTIIIVSILVILLAAAFLVPTLLLNK